MIGIDVSHWQGVIDWLKVVEKVDFAIIKCTQGVDIPDAYYKRNLYDAGALKFPRGAYHFFEPLPDGAKQAEYFYDHLVDQSLNVLAGDFEWGAPGVISNIEKFIKRLNVLTGKMPWIYTNANFWNTYIGPVNPDWAAECPRWISNPSLSTAPYLPKAWGSYELWQYSWTGVVSGISGSVDLNRPRDGFDVLQAFGNEAGNIVLPDGLQFEALVDNQNVRSGPGFGFPIIGHLVDGQVLDVSNVKGTDAWGEIAPGQWAAIYASGREFLRVTNG